MSQPDPYGSLGEKYRFLLGLAPGSAVRLVGDYWTGLAEDFSRSGLHPVGTDRVPVAARLESLEGPRQFTTTEVSIPTILLLRSRSGAPSDVEESRVAAREFIPVPSLSSVEAFIAPSERTGTWSVSEGPFRRLALRLGVRKRERFLFLQPPGSPSGFDRAETLLGRIIGASDPHVERYHLRRRGALVFVLSSGDGPLRVLRVATNSHVATLARRNQSHLVALAEPSALPHAVRDMLPMVLGELNEADVSAFAEEYRPGQLAWTLYRQRAIARRIDDQMLGFAHALQQATVCEKLLDEGEVSRLVDLAVTPIEGRFGRLDGFADLLGAIRTRLRSAWLGRRVRLAASHGDYGVGNVLVDPGGEMTGVVDWDQAEARDIPGTDWCNHVIKSGHFERTTVEALRSLVRVASAGGALAPVRGLFGAADFGLSAPDMRVVPCYAALRDLARSVPFDSELTGEPADYRELLATVLELLSEERPGQGPEST